MGQKIPYRKKGRFWPMAEPHDDDTTPPSAEPTAAEVAAALARLAAGVDQLMALVFRSTRW
ncbi:MAG: hypothetical protein RLZZ516_2313 [Cyanobacteriota bacterium]